MSWKSLNNPDDLENESSSRSNGRHLQVNSDVNRSKPKNEWDRKAHSSPVKGFLRRASGTGTGANQVRVTIDWIC